MFTVSFLLPLRGDLDVTSHVPLGLWPLCSSSSVERTASSLIPHWCCTILFYPGGHFIKHFVDFHWQICSQPIRCSVAYKFSVHWLNAWWNTPLAYLLSLSEITVSEDTSDFFCWSWLAARLSTTPRCPIFPTPRCPSFPRHVVHLSHATTSSCMMFSSPITCCV